MFGVCNLAIVSVRIEPSHKSEMVTQLLFGEHFEIIEKTSGWIRVRIHADGYQGWIDEKQYQTLSEEDFRTLSQKGICVSTDLIEYVSNSDNHLFFIPLGASLSFLDIQTANPSKFTFEGSRNSNLTTKSRLIQTAFMYLNTPYLWGGRTPFGIDCSGFTQMVYRLNGYHLLRDAYQQATQGYPLSFIEEAEPGDLAFFDNEEGKIIHVGIMMNDNYIIHAHGRVRIDRLDHLGIMNVDTKRHTHKLRVIKRIIE